MKNPTFILASAFLVTLPALFVLYLYGPVDAVIAQSASGSTRVARTAKSNVSDNSSSLTKFIPAAAKNDALRSSLSWTFSGKPQTGWNIYVPLISQTIGTDAAPTSPAFAAALSKWQSSTGVTSSGVVDAETLEAFIKFWQARRLGRSSGPEADRLLSAPIGDFYDHTRNADLLKLERDTYTAYRRMIAAASKDLGKSLRFTRTGELADGERFLRIVSAYRSPEYQAELRRKEPNAGRGALAKFSAHGTGQALDLYVGGEPVSTKDPNRLLQVESPAYKWLVKNAHKFGFYPYFYEPWHWEYVPGR